MQAPSGHNLLKVFGHLLHLVLGTGSKLIPHRNKHHLGALLRKRTTTPATHATHTPHASHAISLVFLLLLGIDQTGVILD